MKNRIKKYTKKAGGYIQAYAKMQGEHMRKNKDYWDFDNSSLSAIPSSERKVITRKAKVKIKRSRRRIQRYYPTYAYPQPYYRPRPKRRIVKKVKHTRPSAPREKDPFSMF